jgi:hypothetical protein
VQPREYGRVTADKTSYGSDSSHGIFRCRHSGVVIATPSPNPRDRADDNFQCGAKGRIHRPRIARQTVASMQQSRFCGQLRRCGGTADVERCRVVSLPALASKGDLPSRGSRGD